MVALGRRKLFGLGLKRQDNDLLIIESRAAAMAFEQRFDAIFAGGEALPLASEGNPREWCDRIRFT